MALTRWNALVALGIALAMTGFAPAGIGAPAEDEWRLYLVGLDRTPSQRPGDEFHGARVLSVIGAIDVLSVATKNPKGFEARAAHDPHVRYVEVDRPDAVHTFFVPDDPRQAEQWAWAPAPGIDAYGAWDVTLGSTSVIVAVLDSGLDKSHPDIGNTLQGRDFINNDDDPDDRCAHGTHVAGTVGALTDNGIGVAGTAQATILPVKVLDKWRNTCSGSFAAVASGIAWAADQGAHILSLSLGCNQPCSNQATSDALEYAASLGALAVCAAGNDNGRAVGFPAADPNCMAISAINADGTFASYSSRGPQVELAAPGTSILSTWPGDSYQFASGTSMATPHVSGTAALVLSVAAMGGADLRAHLKATAVDLGLSADRQGAGLVNACAAVGGAACGVGGSDPVDPPEDPPAGTPTVHVHDIQHAMQGRQHLRITVWAYDAAEAPADGVQVAIQVCKEGGACATGSGATSSDGTASFLWRGAGEGTYTTCVTDMTKDGWVWDDEAGHAEAGNCATQAARH